ncbi:GerMN domain-containing protein [Clostridium algidicarnis]|uniref:GerMN domain-containing protein n=1 Tax=Clostridium algidicarnis TaxID=37659 RepID=UPI001C0C79DD|nr:GerMN domain-containing protein [Clostridium algidicarnis]MBU3228636.1 GerMN domain-containing protein [Clostridium algidicarnis]MBU3251318.1 GerMN domain-containing protein [Clostridium algidicarnis]
MDKRFKSALSIGLCFLALTTVACSKKDKISINNKEKFKNIQLPAEKQDNIELDIYFDASKDASKIEIAKEEVLIPKEEVIGQLIVDSLVKGPSINGKLKPVLPKETRLLSFSIKDNIAFVNLSKEALITMTPAKEESVLTSIVASLEQIPSVSKVKILIESKDVETLGGNFDISKPFKRDEIGLLKR